METAFVMECVEEELEPVQHEDELEDDDDELNPAFLPVQTLRNGSREQTEQRRTKLSAMDVFEVALSEEVRKYKHLYNSSLRDHKDSRAVNSSWTEIADTLSADATYCRKRWQNLRDKFTKARRRMMTWRRRPGGRNRVPVLYTVLRWLDCHIKPKPSMKMTISQAEFVMKQEQPSPSYQPISHSPSTDLELDFSAVNADEFDCSALDPPCPAPSPVPTPAPSIPLPGPCPPSTPPPLCPPPTSPTPTASSRPVPSPLPAPPPSPTDVADSCPGPSTASCPGPSTPSCPGPSTPSCPGPSTPSCRGPSADRSVPRSRKRKRTSEPEGLNYQSLFAALDQRRAEREAAMEAGRERRTAVIGRLLEQRDECDRYVLHVADFMRSLPSDHLSEFKFKLQNLMRETEQAVKDEVVENGFAAVKGNGHQNGEER